MVACLDQPLTINRVGVGVVWKWSGGGLEVEWGWPGSGVGVVWKWSGGGPEVEWGWPGSGVGVAWKWSGGGLGVWVETGTKETS